MYLEDVNIEGFKSFSEQTAMGFQPGIGVIIGNNGVGKSNILDAIVWALGEDRLDRFRCYEKDEIFFAGSNDYPPAEKVKVDLKFKMDRGKDSPTIHISRERAPNGEDRYWFGDNAYQRDDYMRKLESLRIHHSLKTIIRQEEINDIIQQPPDRRFQSLMHLMELESEEDFEDRLRTSIAPLFQRYMEHLMPFGKVSLEKIQHNNLKGIEINIDLKGNRKRRAHQLSGGEKSITSLALKLACFDQLDSPFFLLDEVEPSLDYTNHKNMQAFLRDVSGNNQLIMITHLRSTISLADTVHGVRTRFDGSSFMKFYFVMDERLLRLYKCC